MIAFRILTLMLCLAYGQCQTYEELKSHLPERPVFHGVMGKYINYPGLAFEPNMDGLIRFNKARASTFHGYVERLDSKLEEYHNIYQQNQMDCSSYSEYRRYTDWNSNCRFDIIDLGPDCVKQQKYGYEDGQPCIAMSLERIMNWLPEPYTNKTVPDKIRGIWEEYSITVHCEGEDPVSKDNIGDILYFPKGGYHFSHFPNTGIDGWRDPIVFVRLDNPMPAVVIRVTCSVYAKNIKHNDKFATGRLSFDVMVD